MFTVIPKALVVKLLGLMALALLIPTIAVTVHGFGLFERTLLTEANKKTVVVGDAIVGQITRAVGYGIPLDQLVGMNEFLDPIVAANPGLQYIGVVDAQGHVLYASGIEPDVLEREAAGDASGDKRAHQDTQLPILIGDQKVASLHVGTDSNFIADEFRQLTRDLAAVMIVAFLAVVELVLFGVMFNMTSPLRAVRRMMLRGAQGDFTQCVQVASMDELGHWSNTFNTVVRRVNDRYRRLVDLVDEVADSQASDELRHRLNAVLAALGTKASFDENERPRKLVERSFAAIRPQIFLLAFAEFLTLWLLPNHAGGMVDGEFMFSPAFAAALPMSLFYVGILIGVPLSMKLPAMVGAKRLFALGSLAAAAGFAGIALAEDIVWLYGARALVAAGYAASALAFRSYLRGSSNEDQFRRSTISVVWVAAVGAICGALLGGVLSQRLPTDAIFAVSAILVLGAAAFILLWPSQNAQSPSAEGINRDDIADAFLCGRFSALSFAIAVPTQLLLVGVMLFLVPRSLAGFGIDVAASSRAFAIGAAAILGGGWFAMRRAGRAGGSARRMALGIGAAGLAAVAVGVVSSPLALLTGMTVIGAGIGFAIVPQLAAAVDMARRGDVETDVRQTLGVLIAVHGATAVAAPLVAAIGERFVGGAGVIMAFGGVALVAAAIFAVMSRHDGSGEADSAADQTSGD